MRRLVSILLFAGLLLTLGGCGKSSTPRVRPAGPSAAVRITCVERGVYKISGEDLVRLGVDLARIDTENMALVHYDKPVPLLGAGLEDGKFDPADAIYFFSDGGLRDSIPFVNLEKDFYPANQRFMLHLGPSEFEPLRYKVVQARTPANPDPAYARQSVSGLLHFEKNPIFRFIEGGFEEETTATTAADSAKPTDFIYWAALTWPQTNKTASAMSTEFDVPAADKTRPAELRVKLYAATDMETLGELTHRVAVTLNGTPLGEVRWSGTLANLGRLAIPAGTLRLEKNQVEFKLLAPAAANAQSSATAGRFRLDMVMLDWFDVEFKQQTRATRDYAELHIDDAADQRGVSRFVLDNFGGNAIGIFDLAAGEVIEARPFQLEKSWAVNLARPARPATLVACSEQAMLKPFEMKPVTLPGILNQPSDCELLILTHPAFTNELKPLVQWKQSRGLKTRLVEITDLFNEATGGYPAPEAMRRYIEQVYKSQPQPRLRYVMLVGDSVSIAKYPSFCPAYAYLQSGQKANDNYFATFGKPEGTPLLAVGRLSVNTPAQAANIVRKIINYESGRIAGSWQARMLTIAAAFGWAREDAQTIINKFVKPNYLVSHMQTDQTNASPNYHEQVSQELFNRLNEGSLVTVFFGHGGGSVWEVGPAFQSSDFRRHLFDQERVAKLANQDRLPLVFALTCYTNDFDNPTVRQTLGETFLNSPGGAIAVIGAVGRSSTSFNIELLSAILSAVRDHKGERLGDFFRQGLLATGSEYGNINYVLLGDPSLEFALPAADVKLINAHYIPVSGQFEFDYELPAAMQASRTAPTLECFVMNESETAVDHWSALTLGGKGHISHNIGTGKLVGKYRIVVYVKDDAQKPHVGSAVHE